MSVSAEERKRVAEACTGRVAVYQLPIDPGVLYISNEKITGWVLWEPGKDLWQKDALVTKIAELLRKLDESGCGFSYYSDCCDKFLTALATGNIDDLEQLCFELIGDGDAI